MIDYTVLIPYFQDAVDWLDSTQDPKATLFHLGIYLKDNPLKDQLSVSFAPCGSRNGLAAFIFETPYKEDPKSFSGKSQPPLTHMDINNLYWCLWKVGKVTGHWNGVGYCTVSIQIQHRAGLGISQALNNYHKGCPVDKSHRVFCTCPEWRESFKLLKFPEGWR